MPVTILILNHSTIEWLLNVPKDTTEISDIIKDLKHRHIKLV